MPTLLILMILAAIGYVLWDTSRAAAERATELGRNACQAADVQWLDQSVHAIGLRLCRLPSGWLGFERTFRFDYSYDGVERHSGRIVLRGRELAAFTGPAKARVSHLQPRSDATEDLESR
ncbi:DUF3301 domain-containing protein [Stenotrophomonas mori]|uniref:DUF3301 domain-containing protein n=1 Tax=Stenotrophomonas mori TaxID=2871096 RepID=A0ABT0SFV7_9GAMM|nr:DUF3301 domain-containing protein [Stenotrophomonas mori]MCL7714209.1 DUF3301 domain-containing protein [Stenotrophomonas mori]